MGIRFERVALVERGKNEEALAFAATISDHMRTTYGVPVTWGLEVGGTVGVVHWFVDYENMAHLEEVLGKTMTDEGYGKLLAGAVDFFTGPAKDTLVYTM